MSYDEHMGAIIGAETSVDEVMSVVNALLEKFREAAELTGASLERAEDMVGMIINATGENPGNPAAQDALANAVQIKQTELPSIQSIVASLQTDTLPQMLNQLTHIKEQLTEYKAAVS